MPKIYNDSSEEVKADKEIILFMCIIEITGYSFEYIENLPERKFYELAKYCHQRVEERRALVNAWGGKLKELI